MSTMQMSYDQKKSKWEGSPVSNIAVRTLSKGLERSWLQSLFPVVYISHIGKNWIKVWHSLASRTRLSYFLSVENWHCNAKCRYPCSMLWFCVNFSDPFSKERAYCIQWLSALLLDQLGKVRCLAFHFIFPTLRHTWNLKVDQKRCPMEVNDIPGW